MNHIVIAANPYRDIGLQKAVTVYRMLTEHGHRAVIAPVFSPKAYLPDDISPQPLAEAAQGAGLIIVMGGDGTILHVAAQVRDHPIPIIGVNFGRQGLFSRSGGRRAGYPARDRRRTVYDQPPYDA